MTAADPIALEARELAAAVRAGQLSAREVLDAHIERSRRLEPTLNALTWQMHQQARDAADAVDRHRQAGRPLGALAGVPMTIKDQLRVRGAPTTLGVRKRRDHRATDEGPLMRRLRAAGAIPMAKTNVSQLLLYWEADNPLHGATRNPHGTDRSTGGSSGGEGAALAARYSALGIGGDFGGSLRIPAHFCGVATLKPTAWRLSNLDNIDALAPGHELVVAQLGPMARSVDGIVEAMAVLVDPADPDPLVPPVPWEDPRAIDVRGMRVGVAGHAGPLAVGAGVRAGVQRARAALEDAGVKTVDWQLPDPEEAMRLYLGLVTGEGGGRVRELLDGELPDRRLVRMGVGSMLPSAASTLAGRVARRAGQAPLANLLEGVGTRRVAAYQRLLDDRDAYRRRVNASLRELDAVLLAPFATPAYQHGASMDLFCGAHPQLVFNLLGLPAGVVPTGLHGPAEVRPASGDVADRFARRAEQGARRLPVGAQIAARWWHDARVLALMLAVERGLTARGTLPLPTPLD